MKMTVLSLTSAALLLGAGAFAASAQAQESFQYPQGYVGGDAMFWSLNPDRGNSRDDIGLRLRGGAQFNDYFALEGHLGTGGSDRGADLDHLPLMAPTSVGVFLVFRPKNHGPRDITSLRPTSQENEMTQSEVKTIKRNGSRFYVDPVNGSISMLPTFQSLRSSVTYPRSMYWLAFSDASSTESACTTNICSHSMSTRTR